MMCCGVLGGSGSLVVMWPIRTSELGAMIAEYAPIPTRQDGINHCLQGRTIIEETNYVYLTSSKVA